MQSRLCTGPFFGGKPCDGPTVQLAFCSDTPCPGKYRLHRNDNQCEVRYISSSDNSREGMALLFSDNSGSDVEYCAVIINTQVEDVVQ